MPDGRHLISRIECSSLAMQNRSCRKLTIYIPFAHQTRSADEPMTTFVTCTNCGNKWKFC